MHPWVGAGDEDRRHILKELGLESIDQLFASIPAAVCVDALELPPAQDEETVRRALSRMSTANLSMGCVSSSIRRESRTSSRRTSLLRRCGHRF